MNNVFDYIRWRGDLSFAQDPLNAVDAVIFSNLVYIRYPKELVTDGTLTMNQVWDAMRQREDYAQLGNPHQLELLQAAAASHRFGGVRLAQFRSEFIPEEDTQFAALTNLLDDGTLAAAFRGTDNTLVGWKEDFNMSFQEAVPAQRLAVEYVEMLHEHYHLPMSVCGHSKGGNLAMYAAAMSSPEVRQRIQGVYNNDGPGFQKHMLTTPGYLEMVPRIHTFVPQSSIIGMLMEHAEPYRVIKSTQVGIMQHDVFTWEVEGKSFIPVEELTPDAKVVNATIRGWLMSMDLQERNQMVDALFKLLTYGNVERAADIFQPKNIRQYMKLISTDDDIRRILTGEFASLIDAAKNAAAPESQENAEA